MNSLIRDTKSKYDRAVMDIYDMTEEVKTSRAKLATAEGELRMLKLDKLSLTMTVAKQTEENEIMKNSTEEAIEKANKLYDENIDHIDGIEKL